MINALIGDLVQVNANSIVILCGAMEFELTVSGQNAAKLSSLDGTERKNIRILTWLQVRQDGISLFGFSNAEEKKLFLELIKVSGIGPKQAMKILSGVTVEQFIHALDTSDLGFLSRIPGLGQKTSQKIILALRDKLVLEEKVPLQEQKIDRSAYSELISALVEMGYDKKTVKTILDKIVQKNTEKIASLSPSDAEEWLFRQAIFALN